MNTRSSGFTLFEVTISIFIILLIFGVGTMALVNAKKSGDLNSTTDSLAAILEKAKSDARTGKNGQSFGVSFTSSSYIYFSGSSYNASDPLNILYSAPSSVSISTSLSGGSSNIIFARLSASPNATGTITLSAGSQTQRITVGDLGDVNVVK